MSTTATLGRRLLESILYATALVAALSLLSFVPYLGFFAYPLVPGIDLSGLIFSSGVESFHLLRFEIFSVILNIVLYATLLYVLFAEPRTRARRTYSEYYAGMPSGEPAAAASSLPGTAASSLSGTAASSLSGSSAPAMDDMGFENRESE